MGAEAEAALCIEHLFATAHELEGQMPDLLAFARGVGYANVIQMLVGRAGIAEGISIILRRCWANELYTAQTILWGRMTRYFPF